MKTKEEILNDCHQQFVAEKGISSISTKEFPATYATQALMAMEEYAKQIAIAFAIDYAKGALTWGENPSEVENDRWDVRIKYFMEDISKQENNK